MAGKAGMHWVNLKPSPRPFNWRQWQVLDLLAAGLTDLETAAQMGITRVTVSSHVRGAQTASGTKTRAQLFTYYGRLLAAQKFQREAA